jgi:hypothetical protein
MASQAYGAGLSAVVCVQNMWRWRLARDADPEQFDRFWRQLFRFLGQASRQDVGIELADQDCGRAEIRVVLERQPRPSGGARPGQRSFTVTVSARRSDPPKSLGPPAAAPGQIVPCRARTTPSPWRTRGGSGVARR